jgi:hypothetical protein
MNWIQNLKLRYHIRRGHVSLTLNLTFPLDYEFEIDIKRKDFLNLLFAEHFKMNWKGNIINGYLLNDYHEINRTVYKIKPCYYFDLDRKIVLDGEYRLFELLDRFLAECKGNIKYFENQQDIEDTPFIFSNTVMTVSELFNFIRSNSKYCLFVKDHILQVEAI